LDTPRQSGIGIASCITSVVSAGLIFLTVLVLGIMETSTPGGLDEESPEIVGLGLAMFALCGLSLLALCLGIGGLMQKDRGKTFAVIGVAISSLTLGGIFLLILLGLAVS
jgi:hypothetical protein